MTMTHKLLYCHFLGKPDMLTVWRLSRNDITGSLTDKWAFVDRYRICKSDL
jgi:hypothetical protein